MPGTGRRLCNVTIYNTMVLTNFDIFAVAGAKNKAVANTFTENANARLRTIPLDVPDRIGRAWREEARLNPSLVPDYSPWNTRARRARG